MLSIKQIAFLLIVALLAHNAEAGYGHWGERRELVERNKGYKGYKDGVKLKKGYKDGVKLNKGYKDGVKGNKGYKDAKVRRE